MRLIIDTNILFSCLLKKYPIELDIIESETHDIYLCQFTTVELFRHKEKILKISGLTEEEIIDAYHMLLDSLTSLSVKDIPKKILKEAIELCKNIDKKDSMFVAGAVFLDAYLWTGDKKLKKGLTRKGFKNVVSTRELLDS